jgi:hypothetical protein
MLADKKYGAAYCFALELRPALFSFPAILAWPGYGDFCDYILRLLSPFCNRQIQLIF